jgi:hypothetical protein
MNNNDKTDKSIITESNDYFDLDSLVSNLKVEDSRNLRKMRNMKWLYYSMIVIYALLLIVNPDPVLQMHDRISGLCFVTAFILFAVLFSRLHNDYSKIDYALSSAEMLSKAVKRYKFSFTYYPYFLPALVLIDAGLSISEFYRWLSMEPLNRILIVQAFFIPVMVISGFIGYMVWRKRQKPLHDQAEQLLKDLTES